MTIDEYLAPYMFELPSHLIAQKPPQIRGGSRLMLLDKSTGESVPEEFGNLYKLITPGALLVFNEVRVTPARLKGHKKDSGGSLEAFILEPPAPDATAGDYDLWCLVHPGRRVKPGAELVFQQQEKPDVLEAEVLDTNSEGQRLIRFHFQDAPLKVLEELGHVPLPFYIKRPDAAEDRIRYQTVYGKTPGAVAAPTAGLHFTLDMMEKLKRAGYSSAFVTLKVSAGTFAPLNEEQIKTGRLHREHITVPEETAEKIITAKKEGRQVLAVGTTTVRSLEWAAQDGHFGAKEGWSDIFLRPGYQFKVVDSLLTNFHLPGSSLLMLVSALAGRKNILSAYKKAINLNFNFYSYGDAMLIS